MDIQITGPGNASRDFLGQGVPSMEYTGWNMFHPQPAQRPRIATLASDIIRMGPCGDVTMPRYQACGKAWLILDWIIQPAQDMLDFKDWRVKDYHAQMFIPSHKPFQVGCSLYVKLSSLVLRLILILKWMDGLHENRDRFFILLKQNKLWAYFKISTCHQHILCQFGMDNLRARIHGQIGLSGIHMVLPKACHL